MRKYLVLFLVGFAIASAIFLLPRIVARLRFEWQISHFICSYPGYERLVDGMTTTEVDEILGEPLKRIPAEDETQNFYCSFDYYSEAGQCWLYEFPWWDGRILVYFDGENRLIGRSCGSG